MSSNEYWASTIYYITISIIIGSISESRMTSSSIVIVVLVGLSVKSMNDQSPSEESVMSMN